MSKRSAILLLASLSTIVVAVAFWVQTRSIAFDQVMWQSGDAKLRFRMKDSLVARYNSGAFSTLESIDRSLGPDDDSSSEPHRRWFRLMQWHGNPWYLEIRFDEKGNTKAMYAVPD